MNIITRIGALTTCPAERSREVRLVRCGVVTETNIPVNSKVDVLKRELRHGRVERGDFFGQAGDVRLPVGESAAVLLVVELEPGALVVGFEVREEEEGVGVEGVGTVGGGAFGAEGGERGVCHFWGGVGVGVGV